MKKELIILALVLLLSFSIVQATEKTKIWGNVEDSAAVIKITVTYKADNIEYTQSATRNPDDDGIWSYIFYCDSGYLVKGTVDINSKIFDANVTCGKEFRLAYLNGKYIISDGTTVSSAPTTTTTTTTSNSSSTNTTTTNTTTTVTTITNVTASENKTGFFSGFIGKAFNKNLWVTIGKVVLVIILVLVVLAIIYYIVQWFRNRPPGQIKTISFRSKFGSGSDRELDEAEKRLEEVQEQISYIQNKEKRMREVTEKLRSAERELARLKGSKKGESELGF